MTTATSVPTGDRRPVLVTGLTIPRPTTVTATFRAAARLIAARGLHQGDYVPDPRNREMCIPVAMRPMSIVAALRCVVSGDPRRDSVLADEAIGVLALSLDDGPEYGDIRSLEAHVEDWGDAEGRTTECVVAVLEAAADASEVAA